MELLIGTAEGVFLAGKDTGPQKGKGLEGHSLRAVTRANGALLAGAETEVRAAEDLVAAAKSAYEALRTKEEEE